MPPVSITPEQAVEYVGFFHGFCGINGPASARITRDVLGWDPTRPGLTTNLEEGHYFAWPSPVTVGARFL